MKPSGSMSGSIACAFLAAALMSCAGHAPPAARQPMVQEAPRPAPKQFVLALIGSPLENGSFSGLAAYTPEGKRIVTLTAVLDSRSGKVLRRFMPQYVWKSPVAISADRTMIAFPDQGYRGLRNTQDWYGVSLASLSTGQILHTFEIQDISIGAVHFVQGAQELIAVSHDTIYVVDLRSGRITRSRRHRGGLRQVAVAPDGKRYAQLSVIFPTEKNALIDPKASQLRFQVTVLSIETGAELLSFPEVQGRAQSLGWSADGRYLVVASQPEMVVYDLRAGKRLPISPEQWLPDLPTRMLDGRFLLLIDEKAERNAFLDLHTGRTVPIAVPLSGQTRIVAISPNGTGAVVQRYVPGAEPAKAVYLAELKAECSETSGPSRK